MGILGFGKSKPSAQSNVATPSAVYQPSASLPKTGTVNLTKGNRVSLSKSSGGVYTLITAWGSKDYDLYALVEYTDGHVEVVSCFGTLRRPHDFSTRTKDGAVVHVSGDKTANGSDLPQEVMTVTLNPNIRCVVPVVYSAKNSGAGSFHRYNVSTYVIEGNHEEVPTDGTAMIRVEAVDASRDEHVYTFVPAVIHNKPTGAELEGVELYSRKSSELRPIVTDGKVTMDGGEENSNK